MNERAVIYARVSSEGNRQLTDRQVRDLTTFAKAHQYQVVRTFTEKMSGARDDRPVLAECVDFLCDGRADILLLSEISRLGRSVKIIVDTKDRLTKAGINIYIHDMNMFTLLPDGSENPSADILLTMLGLGAQLERKQIMGRLNSGRQAAIARGVIMGRKAGSFMSPVEKQAKYQRPISLLKKGISVRNVASICDLSAGTVQTLKKEFVTTTPVANDDPLSLDTLVATGRMSMRLYCRLTDLGYVTLPDTIEMSENQYLKVRGVGPSAVAELRKILEEHHLQLRT